MSSVYRSPLQWECNDTTQCGLNWIPEATYFSKYLRMLYSLFHEEVKLKLANFQLFDFSYWPHAALEELRTISL